MKTDALIFAYKALLFALFILHVCGLVIEDVTGACGYDMCTSPGFVTCITTPFVDTVSDSYCLECTNERSKCGEPHQMEGCHLFCQEELRSENLELQKKLNKTITELHQSNNETRTLYIIIYVLVGIICSVVLVVAVLIAKKNGLISRLRQIMQKKNRTQKDEEMGTTDKQDFEERNEMERMLPSQKTTEPVSITSQKPNGDIPASDGTCTDNKCTDNGCPAMKKLNNIPPTDCLTPAIQECAPERQRLNDNERNGHVQ